jgi:hypothetical protein
MNHQLVNHQLGTGGRDYCRRDITGYPGWRNPAAFIARIGENISPQATTTYTGECLACTPVRGDNERIK